MDGKVKLTVTLNDYVLTRISEEARSLSVSPEEFASSVVEQAVAQWDRPAKGLQEPDAPIFDPDEPVYELEDVLTEFSAELERRLALKA